MKNPSKTKGVYLNGIFIGDAQTTGDTKTDMEAARQLMIDKGVYKPTTTVQAMYRQAYSFATTSSYLYKRDLSKSPWNGFSVAPFVVNSALSIELYFKTLAQIHNKSLKGHELLKLYDALPVDAVGAIDTAIPGCLVNRGLTNDLSFRDRLSKLNNVFVEWRYLYERETSAELEIPSIIFVMEVLHTACTASPQIAK